MYFFISLILLFSVLMVFYRRFETKTYSMLIREFSFLENTFGFKIRSEQKSGAYYYVDWTNMKIDIKVLYDSREEKPIHILVFDADSLGTIYDVTEYIDEFNMESGTCGEKIKYAAEKLKNSIVDGTFY